MCEVSFRLTEISAILDRLRGQNHDVVISRRKTNDYLGKYHCC